MRTWKWIVIGAFLIIIYATTFIYIYGWIIAVVFSVLLVIFLFIPQGGTIIDAIKKFKVDMDEAKAVDKKDEADILEI